MHHCCEVSLSGHAEEMSDFQAAFDGIPGISTEEYYTGHYTAPHIRQLSAVITASGPTPDEGQSYSLTCELRGAELLAVANPRFRWDEVGGSQGILRAATLTFNPLRPEDAGEYMCTHTFASPYLTGTRTVTARATVTVNREL